MKKISDYIGKPYETYNCFDLVKDFYKDQFDIDISNYYESKEEPSREDAQTLIVSNKGDFIKVDKPKFGDVILIKFFGIECHIGICLDGESFIHSRRGSGSVMEKINRYSLITSGFYRHRIRA